MRARGLFGAGMAVAVVSLLTGCFPGANVGGGGGGNQGSASILTTIDGIDESDRARSNVKYILKCDGKEERLVKQVSADTIVFDGKDLEDGKDACAMEVRADVKEGEKIVWFSIPETPGLFYGSDKKIVESRKLKLTLFKIYVLKTDADTVDVTLRMQFDAGSEDTLPEESKTVASLKCGADLSYPGKYVKGEALKATAKFEGLPIKDVEDKSCEVVSLLVENTALFDAELTGVELKDLLAGDALSFPKDEAQYFTLKAKSVQQDDQIAIDAQQGVCINYDVAQNACLDVKESKELPYAQTYALASIKGRDGGGRGDVVTYLVSVGDGIRKHKEKKITTEALNEYLKSATADSEVKFTIWKADALEAMTSASLTQDAVVGTTFADKKVALATARQVRFLHVEKVYVHGFSVVEKNVLDAKTAAHWFAQIRAEKAGLTAQEFVVAGAKKYFYSDKRAVEVDAKKTHFDAIELLADLADTDAELRWSVYSFEGGASPIAGCAMKKDDFAVKLSDRNRDTMAGDSAELDACAHDRDSIDETVDETWQAKATYYLLGWSAL